MLFLQPMPMDDVAAANRPVAAEISTVTARATAPAWNGVRLAQAGTPGSSSPNPGSGTLLSPPGSAPPVDTPVPPPQPNRVNNGRSPFDSSGNGAGMGSDPGSTTREPSMPEPARPDTTTPSTPSTPNPTTESPIDDTKAPAAPDQTPAPGTAGTSGTQLTPPSQLSPPNQTTTPGASGSSTTPEPTPPRPPTPPADTTTPPPATTPPAEGASGTR